MPHMNDAACTIPHLLMISASLCSSPASMSSPNVFGHVCSLSITWAKPPCMTHIASGTKKERKEPACQYKRSGHRGLPAITCAKPPPCEDTCLIKCQRIKEPICRPKCSVPRILAPCHVCTDTGHFKDKHGGKTVTMRRHIRTMIYLATERGLRHPDQTMGIGVCAHFHGGC